MKTTTNLTLALLLFFFVSCDMANHKAEMDNHIGVWNSVISSMDVLVKRYDDAETRKAIKDLGHFAVKESKALEDRENRLKKDLESTNSEDVKKINGGLLSYLELNHVITAKYEELSTSIDSLKDAEIETKLDEIDTLIDSMTVKAKEVMALQDEYAKKHGITLENH